MGLKWNDGKVTHQLVGEIPAGKTRTVYTAACKDIPRKLMKAGNLIMPMHADYSAFIEVTCPFCKQIPETTKHFVNPKIKEVEI